MARGFEHISDEQERLEWRYATMVFATRMLLNASSMDFGEEVNIALFSLTRDTSPDELHTVASASILHQLSEGIDTAIRYDHAVSALGYNVRLACTVDECRDVFEHAQEAIETCGLSPLFSDRTAVAGENLKRIVKISIDINNRRGIVPVEVEIPEVAAEFISRYVEDHAPDMIIGPTGQEAYYLGDIPVPTFMEDRYYYDSMHTVSQSTEWLQSFLADLAEFHAASLHQ
jgi:hypothetical protein